MNEYLQSAAELFQDPKWIIGLLIFGIIIPLLWFLISYIIRRILARHSKYVKKIQDIRYNKRKDLIENLKSNNTGLILFAIHAAVRLLLILIILTIIIVFLCCILIIVSAEDVGSPAIYFYFVFFVIFTIWEFYLFYKIECAIEDWLIFRKIIKEFKYTTNN